MGDEGKVSECGDREDGGRVRETQGWGRTGRIGKHQTDDPFRIQNEYSADCERCSSLGQDEMKWKMISDE